MNTLFRNVAFVLVALVALGIPAHAQTIITPTTLSAAIDSKQTVMTVASATGINAPAFPSAPQLPPTASVCVIDNHELVEVRATNSTSITIRRGTGGSTASAHAKNALVFCSSPVNIKALKIESELAGSCTRGTFPADVLPKLNIVTGIISDCLGGVWVNGVNAQFPRFRVVSPEAASAAYTGINTNGTTLSATILYCSEVFLPANKNLTGIALLNGTTVGTDKRVVVLYDAAGNAIANSATAGVTSASASVFQEFSFTAKYFAVGPAQYFACFQSNGTTDTVRMSLTGLNDNLLTKGQTGGTFGTIPALVVPTTFTTAVGPYVYLF